MIRSAWIKGYRNLSETLLHFPQGQSLVIWGNNNQGKTNLLDALYFAANGHSTLKASDEELVREGQNKAQVGLLFTDPQGTEHRLYVQLSQNGDKQVVLDQRLVKRRQDAFSQVIMDYWSMDLIRLFQDAPEQRRKELDRFLCLTQSGYPRLLQDYERTVRHKVELLKSGTFTGLETWNQKLVELAVPLVALRRKGLKVLESEMAQCLPKLRENLSDRIAIRYVGKHVDLETYPDSLQAALARYADAEKSRKQALVGPHRDDFDIVLDQKPLFTMWSRGINRTVAIAFRWAEFSERLKLKPRPALLLLDDACAEIDATGKRNILSFLENHVALVYASTASDRAFFLLGVTEKEVREGQLIEQ